MIRNWLLWSSILCGAIPSALAQAQSDQILSRTGSSFSGKVLGSTPAEITIEVSGNRRSVKVNDIRRVMFAEDPAELKSGRAKALAGKFQPGLSDLKRVDPASIEREIVRRDLQFFLAYCQGRLALTAGGDKGKAAQAMLAFVRAEPSSFHFFEAAELLGDLAVSQEDYASAVRYYGTIASKAPFPEYKMRALILEARALTAQGKEDEAEEKFDAVLAMGSDTTESRRQKKFAQVGKARCLAATGSPAEGVALIDEIIASNDASDAELFGRAYNAQGHCLLKDGKPKEALMAYLHVDVLFYANPDVHAESLYQLSKLWAVVKKTDRAVAAKNLLDGRYPGSVWSKKQ